MIKFFKKFSSSCAGILKRFFIWTFQFICSIFLFFFAAVYLVCSNSGAYIVSFFLYFWRYICSSNFLNFLKEVHWPLFEFIPLIFYRQGFGRWKQKRMVVQCEIIPFRRFVSDWIFLLLYLFFRSGYFNLVAKRFGYTDFRFSDISFRKRDVIKKLGEQYKNFYDLNQLYKTKATSFGKDDLKSFFGFPPIFHLFLDIQSFDDFLRSNFTVVDGFVVDFFSEACSDELRAYLGKFQSAGLCGNVLSESFISTLANNSDFKDLDRLKSQHAISLRVLRNLLIYEYFRFYSQGGLNAFRQYCRFAHFLDKEDSVNFFEEYIRVKWPRLAFLYLASRGSSKPSGRPKRRFWSRSKPQFSFFVRLRHFLRRLRAFRSLRYYFKLRKQHGSMSSSSLSYEFAQSFRSAPSFPSFFFGLLLYGTLLVTDGLTYCRDQFYFVTLKFNLYLLPSVFFNVLLLFLFFIFYFLLNNVKKIIFFVSAFINFLLDLKVSETPRPFDSFSKYGLNGLIRCILSYGPSTQDFYSLDWDFKYFYFLTRVKLINLWGFVRAVFSFLAFFILPLVRRGPVGLFRKYWKNPKVRKVFYFVTFGLLIISIIYILYRQYSLVIEFAAIAAKSRDAKALNKWFMNRLTLPEKYVWYQFLSARRAKRNVKYIGKRFRVKFEKWVRGKIDKQRLKKRKNVRKWYYRVHIQFIIGRTIRRFFKFSKILYSFVWQCSLLFYSYILLLVGYIFKFLVYSLYLPFKILVLPYVVYVVLTRSGIWFYKQVIRNPQIRDVLRRYRRALKWFILINLLTLFMLNVWRYYFLGSVGFFEELAEILLFMFDEFDLFLFCCLFLVGLQLIADNYVSTNDYTDYMELAYNFVTNWDFLFFIAILLGVLYLIFKRLFYLVKRLGNAFFSDTPTSREQLFLDDLEARERVFQRRLFNSPVPYVPFQATIEMVVRICAYGSVVFLLSFVLFARFIRFVRKFVRKQSRIGRVYKFTFNFKIKGKFVTVVLKLRKYRVLTKPILKVFLWSILKTLKILFRKFLMLFVMKFRLFIITLCVEFYWSIFSFLGAFRYIFIDLGLNGLKFCIFKVKQIVKRLVFFFFANFFKILLFVLASPVWFFFILSVFLIFFVYTAVVLFLTVFGIRRLFKRARAELYSFPYYDRPVYAFFKFFVFFVKFVVLVFIALVALLYFFARLLLL